MPANQAGLRTCVLGVIIGCLLYAAFLLVFKEIDVSVVNRLNKELHIVSNDTAVANWLEGITLHNAKGHTVHHATIQRQTPDHAKVKRSESNFQRRGDDRSSKGDVSRKDRARTDAAVAASLHASVKSSAQQLTEQGIDATAAARKSDSNGLSSGMSPTVHSKSSDSNSAKEGCVTMLRRYGVIPGSSWGTLPVNMQRSWKRHRCDDVVRDELILPPELAETPSSQSTVSKQQSTVPSAEGEKPRQDDPISGKKKVRKVTAGLAEVPKEDKDWCNDMRRKYEVIPMKSWGRLPLNLIDNWKGRACDQVFTNQRMSKRPIANCVSNATTATTSSVVSWLGGKKQETGNSALAEGINDLPLIAVMAATTTRKVKNPSTSKLALFKYLLPSLMRTVDCGFRYVYVLGYDVGDPYYDSKEGMSEVQKWFSDNVELPMKKNGIQLKLLLVRVNNTLKKPGPVFLEMARAAFQEGAEYFYRINDDTELLANWPKVFVHAVKRLGPPYGVIGPLCNKGNEKILTHDFVHRTHMEIFEMNYYPPQLTDWWMDDWISWVYGQQRTLKAKSAPVIHHTGAHGQRYQVDRSHERLLGGLVEEGRRRIRQWMLKHNVSTMNLEKYDSDKYRPGFVHRDISSLKF